MNPMLQWTWRFGRIAPMWLVAAAWMLASTMAAADSLATLARSELPVLPSSEPLLGISGFGGGTLAWSVESCWQLDADGKSWRRISWPARDDGKVVLSVAGGGQRSWAMLGGGDGQHIDRVAQLTGTDGSMSLRELPALPQVLADARLAMLADRLFVAGRNEAGRASLLSIRPDAQPPAWTPVPAWPNAALPLALVAQTKALHAIVADAAGQQRVLRLGEGDAWQDRGAVPGRAIAASIHAIGQAHLVMALEREGSSPVLATFHTITGSWATLPDSTIAQAGVIGGWRNGVLWGRVDGGGTAFSTLQLESGKLLLRWPDWVVIIVYLVSMLAMGFWFYIREKRNSTSDFFVGGRSIPFWAAGVSLYAANTSSISFIAIPAKAFETNWQYLTNNLVAVLGLMFVATWIVPLLRRLDLMSVFSYLETRFHPAIRMLASALCIVMQVGSRMSVVLFLPALAIATITGIPVEWSILMMGGFTIIYTAMGGMKAVIWTDFVQVIVKMGGAVFAILFVIWTLKGGFGEFVDVAREADKTNLFDFSFDLTKATVWGFIFLVLFDVVLTFPKDQVLMQRTLSTASDKEAGRSIWAFALIMIPGGFIFYSIGTALYVYYKANPERLNPLLPIDATFPLFIAAELPVGVTGLIIAGIFAAAMATLSSIMNSVATLASVDFYEKLAKNPTPKKSVLFAEIATVVTGLAGIGVAMLLSRFDIHSLFDVSIELAGLLGGGFAGAYTLGMFTRRANSAGVAIGVASSIALTMIAWSMSLVHPYFYLAISIMLCIVIGYLASLLFPAPTRSLDGLTIYRDRPDGRSAVPEQ